MKRIIIYIFCIIFVVSALTACGSDSTKPAITAPPALEPNELPEEDLTNTLKSDGFGVNIYKTYCEIAIYEGGKEEVVIPETFLGIPVKKISDFAFCRDTKLKKVTLSSGIKVIGRQAFEECEKLTDVVLNEGLEVIGTGAFKNTPIESVTLPSTLITLGKQSFYRTKISEITIPDGVSEISEHAFYGCENLSEINFGIRVTEISEKAFYNCTSLKELAIPEVVTKIGEYAFQGCSNMEKIFVPALSDIGENPFLYCQKVVIYTPKGSKMAKLAKKYGYEYKSCSSAEKMTEEEK